MVEPQEQQRRRIVPQNELELNLMVTEPTYGKSNEVSDGLKERLKKYFIKLGYQDIVHKTCKNVVAFDENNKKYYCEVCKKYLNPIECIQQPRAVTTENLWDLLSFFSRDLRLANLSDKPWNNEVCYCQYYLDLAHDLLMENYIEPFIISLERVASVTEISQSKEGFLRIRMNTFTAESVTREMEPPKKTLFGQGQKKQNGGM